MSTRQRPVDLAIADARRLALRVGSEVKEQRLTLGISQDLAAARAGLSESAYARLERGQAGRPTLERLCRAARAVGLEPSLGLHPTGEPIRDAAQLALLARFEALLAAGLVLHREVPLPIIGDRRAWDGRVSDGSRTASIEAESKLHDTQALARRIALKTRDDPRSGVIVLLVNQTAHNRRVLAQHREALRAQFPLDGGAIARALRSGSVPAASGLILL
jgi:transcriptional regulator with XRE-family HTH domain